MTVFEKTERTWIFEYRQIGVGFGRFVMMKWLASWSGFRNLPADNALAIRRQCLEVTGAHRIDRGHATDDFALEEWLATKAKKSRIHDKKVCTNEDWVLG